MASEHIHRWDTARSRCLECGQDAEDVATELAQQLAQAREALETERAAHEQALQWGQHHAERAGWYQHELQGQDVSIDALKERLADTLAYRDGLLKKIEEFAIQCATADTERERLQGALAEWHHRAIIAEESADAIDLDIKAQNAAMRALLEQAADMCGDKRWTTVNAETFLILAEEIRAFLAQYKEQGDE